ncbi:chorismate lyase [Parasulfuritortus cantonensis]|uniref:Probable chorismate pyruvate-lyase n=1 Tax=Parasulfuritortus cantonensis TaxID=2528202 RepID=A0A4V6NAW7_9PROT|nr:chorismate lyase [Parasulfuritortus cantonensis]TCJ11796.1 chorismate lyase [Parasulfuritortus cantonensis]
MTNWHLATSTMAPWRPWLIHHGSLTRLLSSRFPDFNVRRLRQAFDLPYRDEVAPLGLGGHERALVREVLLRSGSVPLVYAHTVIPSACLRGPWRQLAGLGNQSLGATLFADPRVERFPLAFRRVSRRHPLYLAAAPYLTEPAAALWARRSQFALAGHRLMVTEVFLPSVIRP